MHNTLDKATYLTLPSTNTYINYQIYAL